VTSIAFDLGDGVTVRTFVPGDAQELFDLVAANRAHLRPWMHWEPLTVSVEDSRTFIEKCLAHPTDVEGNGLWDGPTMIGGIGLSLDTLANSGEIGYWLDPRYEGRGIVTRACASFFDFAFDELGLHRMELSAAVENARSRAVAERLGMQQEGIARDGCRVAGGYLDLVTYGMLEDEWRARREQDG
jgi:ribosomal-protein-serine acetyltransferase